MGCLRDIIQIFSFHILKTALLTGPAVSESYSL